MFDRQEKGEHALLIHPFIDGSPASNESMEEFADLTRSVGATIAGEITARLHRPSPALLIGSGKLDEVKAAILATQADLILVNHALTPVQERNLERYLERRVVDRTGLILDIFAQRARSHEGKLQVELAQLRHLATRLVRGWTHLERQRGGSIGLRGPGETQLETDRRLLQKRVEQLQKRLDRVHVQRTQMSRARVRTSVPRVALVGYTNAGKSTLFNMLTGADTYAADQLFATLDPTVRQLSLPGGSIALADTVGFIRDIPHELIAAFRATLSEARDADLLLHVVDASDMQLTEHIEQVDEVLKAIGAGDIPQLLVFNKIDCLEHPDPRFEPASSLGEYGRVWLSAKQGSGVDALRKAMQQLLALDHVHGTIRVDLSAGRLRAQLYAIDGVCKEQADEAGWLIEIDLPTVTARRLAATAEGRPLRQLIVEPGAF